MKGKDFLGELINLFLFSSNFVEDSANILKEAIRKKETEMSLLLEQFVHEKEQNEILTDSICDVCDTYSVAGMRIGVLIILDILFAEF
ncbi:hypothetical protein [Bacteroides acidifaciens]|uniref:hypothetical protein n=1 Tax=Bacteroides acidifaciens TaxID=85831 RepID=UPI0025A59C58|nr:hypothetical protein [Bacteroides acidifaciens]